jgi:hypothetical protein
MVSTTIHRGGHAFSDNHPFFDKHMRVQVQAETEYLSLSQAITNQAGQSHAVCSEATAAHAVVTVTADHDGDHQCMMLKDLHNNACTTSTLPMLLQAEDCPTSSAPLTAHTIMDCFRCCLIQIRAFSSLWLYTPQTSRLKITPIYLASAAGRLPAFTWHSCQITHDECPHKQYPTDQQPLQAAEVKTIELLQVAALDHHPLQHMMPQHAVCAAVCVPQL